MTLRVTPDPADPRLTRRVTGRDQSGAAIEASVTVERPLTLYLNGQEIVTMMTILDRPEDLAIGYLLNQGMLRGTDVIEDVQYDDDLGVVVVRTPHRTDFEQKLTKKTLTSGCAQGTAFGDLMEGFSEIRLDPDARLSTSGLYRLLHRMIGGQSTEKDIALLESVANNINGKSLCAFGDAAATPVLTTLKWFRPEFEAYVKGQQPMPASYRASAFAKATADKPPVETH